MPGLTPRDLLELTPELIGELSRADLERTALLVVELALDQANRLGRNSDNSSQPPSKDDPYQRQEQRERGRQERQTGDGVDGDGDQGATGNTRPDGAVSQEGSAAGVPAKPPAKPPGKRPGMPGFWRTQPIVVTGTVDHDPPHCARCEAALGVADRRRVAEAFCVYELHREPLALRVTCLKHRYHVALCGVCGHETAARPGTGAKSVVEGRKRDLLLTERCLVGPLLATFIAALSLRYRLSRTKIQEFLGDWLGFELGVASINRCVHEFGAASEPVVEDLLKEVHVAALANVDETPWYQAGVLCWLWVVVTATAVVYRIGSRAKTELTLLIGEAFMGFLVSDGYKAYRDIERRQRCIAHLIRKAVALEKGFFRAGSAFGHDLARDLRALIHEVAEGGRSDRIKRLMKRIKWSCQCNQWEVEEKVRALAREILNDWEAVMAFVDNPWLPVTNNDAERALRHAVIARYISFGTRTDEGSRFYAAGLSVIDTCRKRGIDPWTFAAKMIAAARTGAPQTKIPTAKSAAAA
jgi:transposase